MKSRLTSKKGLRLPSLLQTGSWASNKYFLVRAILSLASENGALNDRRSTKSRGSIMSKCDGLSEEQRLALLEEKFPNSPHPERLRFLRACRGSVEKATAKLQAYHDWLTAHGLDLPEHSDIGLCLETNTTSDELDWLHACKLAIVHMDKTQTESPSKKQSTPKSFVLPQIVFAYSDDNGIPRTSKCGRRLLHVLPARINKKLASAETYALALSLYLHRKQDRTKLDLFFVMLDVRPGKGWSNPPAYTMMPFIRAAGHLLHENYPERLDKLLLYPLPRPALWIWEMVKPFLDPSVVHSAHLIGGKDSLSSPPPNHVLSEFVDTELLDLMEKTRIDNFLDNCCDIENSSTLNSTFVTAPSAT